MRAGSLMSSLKSSGLGNGVTGVFKSRSEQGLDSGFSAIKDECGESFGRRMTEERTVTSGKELRVKDDEGLVREWP